MISDDPILKVVPKQEVRRITSYDAVTQKEQSVIHVIGCDKVVLKTSYAGAQGPKGDTSTFNDLELPSLKARFLGGLQ